MVYGCDPAWWRHRQGLPAFKGLKVAWSGARLDYPDILGAEINRTGAGFSDRMLFEQTGRIGGGGNSGFQALNLIVQFGCRRVVLIGFDMTDRSGVHWYGRNTWAMANNPDESNFRRWRAAFEAASPVLAGRGVDVVNASPVSELKGFRRSSVEYAMQSWGVE